MSDLKVRPPKRPALQFHSKKKQIPRHRAGKLTPLGTQSTSQRRPREKRRGRYIGKCKSPRRSAGATFGKTQSRKADSSPAKIRRVRNDNRV
jgi:hypothetical protein